MLFCQHDVVEVPHPHVRNANNKQSIPASIPSEVGDEAEYPQLQVLLHPQLQLQELQLQELPVNEFCE